MIKIYEYLNDGYKKGNFVMYYDCDKCNLNSTLEDRDDWSIYTDDVDRAIAHATKNGYKYVVKITYDTYEPVTDIYTGNTTKKIVWTNPNK